MGLGQAHRPHENIAYQWFFGAGQSIFEVALRLVTESKQHSTKDTARLHDSLRSVLIQSGVVVAAANDLEWIHLSVAEYLASQMLARKGTPDQWLWLADRPTTANIARLALVNFARANGLPFALIEQLTTQESARLALLELLGTPGLLPDETVAQLARSAEASGSLDSAPFGAYPAAAAVLRAALTRSRLAQRLASAKALIADGSLSDARSAIAVVGRAAASPWHPRARLRALDQLVASARQRPDGTDLDEDIDDTCRAAVKRS